MLEKQDTISKAHLAAGRAVDHLRRQLGLVFQEDDGKFLGACPVEGLTAGLLADLQTLPQTRLRLLLTGARARYLRLDVKDAKAVIIDAQYMPLSVLQALADPLANETPLPEITPLLPEPSHEMLLTLAKHASLLPAMLLVESDALPEDWIRIKLADVKSYWAAPRFDIVPLARAALPVEGAEHAVLHCFRERYGTSVHLAMVFGGAAGPAPLVRVHSSCITGDILGSLRCDCGDQLRLALQHIGEAKSGILLYLHQEGRGIGIANKLRAYQLQERGVDTYEANAMLGFDEDERDFSIAGAILETMKVQKIRMLTNNPHKLAAMERTGITVAERVPLICPPGAHNHAYIDAKAKKAGHLF